MWWCGAAVQERSVFRRIVLKNAYMRRKMFEELLESVPLLKSLNVSPTNGILFLYSNVGKYAPQSLKGYSYLRGFQIS